MCQRVSHRSARQQQHRLCRPACMHACVRSQGIVKQFFNEKEVTSTLVMDALYSGCKQIEEHSRSFIEVRGAAGRRAASTTCKQHACTPRHDACAGKAACMRHTDLVQDPYPLRPSYKGSLRRLYLSGRVGRPMPALQLHAQRAMHAHMHTHARTHAHACRLRSLRSQLPVMPLGARQWCLWSHNCATVLRMQCLWYSLASLQHAGKVSKPGSHFTRITPAPHRMLSPARCCRRRSRPRLQC